MTVTIQSPPIAQPDQYTFLFSVDQNIPAGTYYPIPLYKQKAFEAYWPGGELPVTEALCRSVIALPMHSELSPTIQDQIIAAIKEFFK